MGKKLEKNFPLISASQGADDSKNQFFVNLNLKKNQRKSILIGKGVSFDTGG